MQISITRHEKQSEHASFFRFFVCLSEPRLCLLVVHCQSHVAAITVRQALRQGYSRWKPLRFYACHTQASCPQKCSLCKCIAYLASWSLCTYPHERTCPLKAICSATKRMCTTVANMKTWWCNQASQHHQVRRAQTKAPLQLTGMSFLSIVRLCTHPHTTPLVIMERDNLQTHPAK